MNRTFNKWLVMGMILVVAVLMVNWCLTYRNTRQLHDDAYWVAHTNEVLGALDNILSTMKDAETGQRGFLITGHEDYLKPYHDALVAMGGMLTELKRLTQDDDRQRARIPRLQELLQAKLDGLARNIALRKEQGFEAAQKEVSTNLGKNRMDAIRAVIAEMKTDEQSLLRIRQENNDRAYRKALVSGGLITATGLAVVLGFILAVQRHLRAQVQAAIVLHEQREWFRTTLGSIGDAVIATDTQGCVTFLNPIAESLTGWNQKAAVGMPLVTLFKIINEQSREPVEDPASRVLREGIIVGLANHTVLIAKDGSERLIDDSAAPIRDEQGRVIGVVLVFRDITERRHRELQRADAQAQLRSVVNHIIDGIISIDEGGMIQTFNPAAERLFGYSAEEVKSRNVAMLMPEPFHHEHDTYIANYRRTAHAKIIGIGREVEGRRKDGSTFPMDLAVSEFYLGDRRYFTGIVRDITERKRAEQALREADRRKDDFLAILSHELRNPLAPIRMAVALLQKIGPAEPELQELRDVIDRQTGQLARLLDDLLDVSRITSGKIVLRKEPVSLGLAVAGAVESIRPLIDSHGHDLTVRVPANPIYIEGDLARLTQVFTNLLNNAAKYTEKGGNISLTVEREGSDAVVRVRDTGIGIPTDQLAHIFEMFVQVDQSLERTRSGLGVGLSLVHRLIELHGGRIEARSDGLGEGSEFIVRLPVMISPAPLAPAPPPEIDDAPPGRPRYRILVADDNLDSATILAKILRHRGHDVRTAHDGPAAIELAQSFRPDLAMLDIGMPKLNGYEVARRIRSEFGDRIVLVAITGWGQEEDQRSAMEAGFNHHLTKPVGLADLDKLLAQITPVPRSGV